MRPTRVVQSYLLINYRPIRRLIPGGAVLFCRPGECPQLWTDRTQFIEAFCWLLRNRHRLGGELMRVGEGTWEGAKPSAGQMLLGGIVTGSV